MENIIGLDISSLANNFFQFESGSKIFYPISKFNIFIGKNNSGKSLFLRHLFKQNDTAKRYLNINSERKALENSHNHVNEFQEFLRNILTTEDRKDLPSVFTSFAKLIEFYLTLLKYKDQSFLANHFSDLAPEILRGRLKEIDNMITNIEAIIRGQMVNNADENTKVLNFYFPVLRSLRPIDVSVDEPSSSSQFGNRDLLKSRTLFEYFISETPYVINSIFSGLTFFDDIHKLICGTEDQRNILFEFETFLSENIFEEKVILIPKYESKFVEIKIGSELQLPVYEIGDGFQSIIIILFYVFKNKNLKGFYFIEEPENHLHPNLQKKLIKALSNPIFELNKYFITTHSNVFINNESTSLFRFYRNSKVTHLKYVNSDIKKRNVLLELGYKNSDLLQANFILWVEGESDKIYLEKLILQLCPDLIMGLDFQILTFGGDGGRHLFKHESENRFFLIDSINPNFGIIIDSDKKAENDEILSWKTSIKNVSNTNSKFCYITDNREFENHIEFNDYVLAAKIVHKNDDLIFKSGKYADRSKFKDPKSQQSIKRKFVYSEELHNRILQLNGNIKSVPASVFKKEFDIFLKGDQETNGNVNKIKVAEELVKSELRVDNNMKNAIIDLIKLIKKSD